MAKRKPLYKSLTIHSAILLAAIVLLRTFFPDKVGDELFHTLLSVFGLGSVVGMRRALPILIIGVIPLGIVQCGPTVCSKASIVVSKHPELPAPAGKVSVKCDGKDAAVLLGKEIVK